MHTFVYGMFVLLGLMIETHFVPFFLFCFTSTFVFLLLFGSAYLRKKETTSKYYSLKIGYQIVLRAHLFGKDHFDRIKKGKNREKKAFL
jgi:hypothetical protein